MLRTSSDNVPPVPRHGLAVSVPRDYWSPFQFHGAPGRTSPWISSRTCQTQGALWRSWLWWTASLRGASWFPSKVCPLPCKRLPEDIVSDWGPQFTSRVWRALCMRLDIGVSLSSSHHPQSNGQAECLNQEIGHFLRSYCSREQQRWSEFLPWAEYAQNSLTHSSTGLTPFQCVLGYHSPLFPWSGEPSSIPAVEEWY
ncbi:hypothetical protein QTP86_004831 [Hemibagrus guttatus]|nr:hypothetical protein QTP86_004831 [Hemibagrus guttatus]